MEIVEIISHYIDKNQNIINVEFKLLGDDEDIVREDIIEYSFFEEFGYDNKKSYDIFENSRRDKSVEFNADVFANFERKQLTQKLSSLLSELLMR